MGNENENQLDSRETVPALETCVNHSQALAGPGLTALHRASCIQ